MSLRVKGSCKSKLSDSKLRNSITLFIRYFGEIEKHFSTSFGAPLLLSPRDVAKAEEWLATGIPVRAIKQGIDRYFERLAPQRRRRALSLRYCENDVLDIWERIRTRGAGGREGKKQKAEDKIKKFLNKIKRAEKKSAKTDGADWLAPLWKILSSEAEKALKKKASLKNLSARLERSVQKYLKANAPKELTKKYFEDIGRELAPYRLRMDDSAFKKTVEYYAFERIRREFGAPKFE